MPVNPKSLANLNNGSPERVKKIIENRQRNKLIASTRRQEIGEILKNELNKVIKVEVNGEIVEMTPKDLIARRLLNIVSDDRTPPETFLKAFNCLAEFIGESPKQSVSVSTDNTGYTNITFSSSDKEKMNKLILKTLGQNQEDK